ncbi:MAG: hypothetical protein ACI86S_002279, partial [Paracoccaceae bacterium]
MAGQEPAAFDSYQNVRWENLTWIKATPPLKWETQKHKKKSCSRIRVRQTKGTHVMWDWIKIALFGVIALGAALAANWARDLAYQIHALIVMAVAAG